MADEARDAHPRVAITPRARWLAAQATVVVAGVAVYFGVRGRTVGASDAAREHAGQVLRLERSLGIDVEAAAQDLVVDSPTLSTLANWVYIWGHWPVIVAAMLWLVLRHPVGFVRLRDAMLVSGALGMLTFALYPVMPPRLTGLGYVDTVTEQSHAYRVLQPPSFVNPYAAMPSLHVGWNLLVGVCVLAVAGSVWLRVAAVAGPVLMAVAVVATANHYLLDAVLGVAYAVAGLAAAALLNARRRRSTAGEVGPTVVIPAPRAAQPGERPVGRPCP